LLAPIRRGFRCLNAQPAAQIAGALLADFVGDRPLNALQARVAPQKDRPLRPSARRAAHGGDSRSTGLAVVPQNLKAQASCDVDRVDRRSFYARSPQDGVNGVIQGATRFGLTVGKHAT
jgi:hypothetical protein